MQELSTPEKGTQTDSLKCPDMAFANDLLVPHDSDVTVPLALLDTNPSMRKGNKRLQIVSYFLSIYGRQYDLSHEIYFQCSISSDTHGQ